MQQGGTLRLAGDLTVNGNSVTAGSGGSGSGSANGASGSAFGSGIFLQGNGTLTFSPGAGNMQTIADTIADQTGSGGSGANAGSWGINVNGAGTLVLSGANTYTGATTVMAGTLAVTGSIANSDVTVSGGVFGGSGTAKSLTGQSGGTVAPGVLTPGTTFTTLNVTGKATFASRLDLRAERRGHRARFLIVSAFLARLMRRPIRTTRHITPSMIRAKEERRGWP